MTRLYLLDTNILSDLIKNPTGLAANRIRTVGETAVCTSIIVAAELPYGCVRKNSPALTQKVEDLLGVIRVLPLDAPVDRDYGDIRAELEAVGRSIGPNDLIIAAHARALGATMVTANLDEFTRVPGLLVENWLQPPAEQGMA